MLKRPCSGVSHGRPLARQRGVVLVIALVVLVAMMLAGIALVRSVDTTNFIAGNLAFQQAATHSGDTGIEAAVGWLSAPTASLNADSLANGYHAAGAGPAYMPGVGESWADFWAASNWDSGSKTLLADGAGNTVSYVIQRLCQGAGAPSSATCASTPNFDPSSGKLQTTAIQGTPLYLYRITARIAGPRSTVSYVQSIVSM